jgi:hypothetical protein
MARHGIQGRPGGKENGPQNGRWLHDVSTGKGIGTIDVKQTARLNDKRAGDFPQEQGCAPPAAYVKASQFASRFQFRWMWSGMTQNVRRMPERQGVGAPVSLMHGEALYVEVEIVVCS